MIGHDHLVIGEKCSPHLGGVYHTIVIGIGEGSPHLGEISSLIPGPNKVEFDVENTRERSPARYGNSACLISRCDIPCSDTQYFSMISGESG